ncbi:MAG: HAD hydrolase-like protein [Bacteroidota bacterium]|nr:HAD hydrolase-like protein [Bacteroidota bacterium]
MSEAICVEHGKIAYVGDTDTDMQTAKNAGMIAFGASWGFRTKQELQENGADHILDHPMDLLKFC